MTVTGSRGRTAGIVALVGVIAANSACTGSEPVASTDPPVAEMSTEVPDGAVAVRVEQRCVCAPLFAAPGPWFTLYGDGHAIYERNGTWRTAQLDRADKAALWATIVDLDLPGRSMIEPADVAAEDEVVNTILVASGNGTLIEHEVVVGVDGPHGPLGELLVEVASLTDRLDGTSWTTETWIGPTSGGCIDYAEPPTSGPEFELRQPVMPDMSSWTFDQITYGAGCAN